jgi:hypothetical protein
MNQLTTTEFIQRVKAKHGDMLDCSLVEYRSYKKSVDLICRKLAPSVCPPKRFCIARPGDVRDVRGI